MKSEHTKGPWEAQNERVAMSESPYLCICEMQDVKTRDEETRANARLMAAAPELLEVAEAVVLLSEGLGRLNLFEVAGMARAAIDKLTVARVIELKLVGNLYPSQEQKETGQ